MYVKSKRTFQGHVEVLWKRIHQNYVELSKSNFISQLQRFVFGLLRFDIICTVHTFGRGRQEQACLRNYLQKPRQFLPPIDKTS